MTAAGERPWYRQFWPWFILAPVIASVIGGFATLFIAGGEPPLAVSDAGQIALAVERDQQLDRRAGALGLVAELQFEPGPADPAEQVVVRLAGAAPPRLRLDLIHPTRDDRDAHVLLNHTGEAYRGAITRRPGRLYLQLGDEAGTWRLIGELAPGQRLARLTPAPAPPLTQAP